MRKSLYPLYAWPMAIGYILLLFIVGYSRAIAMLVSAGVQRLRRGRQPASVTVPYFERDSGGFMTASERTVPTSVDAARDSGRRVVSLDAYRQRKRASA